MLTEKQSQIIQAPYSNLNCGVYKIAYEILFNKKPSSCNCNCRIIYKLINEKLSENENDSTGAQSEFESVKRNIVINPRDNESGKFVSKAVLEEIEKSKPQPILTDDEFILQVKNELIAGYNDIERIRKAYSLITSTGELSNIRVMKNTIMNY